MEKLGSIWSSTIPYKANIRFPEKGNYCIKMNHAMRDEELKAITDIGVRIEKRINTVGKNKLQRFAENATYEHVVQPDIIEARFQDNPIKGNWRKQMFKNSNPIVVELGCGKGDIQLNWRTKIPTLTISE